MKRFKRLFFVVLTLILITGTSLPDITTYAASTKKTVVNSRKLKLKKKTLSLTKGKKATLKLAVNKTNRKVKWYSSKKSVATVNSKGKITAKAVGKTTITVKAGRYKAKCKITVKKAAKKKKASKSSFERKIDNNIDSYNNFIHDVLKYTNQYRVKNGKAKLKLNSNLTYIASYRSLEMAKTNDLSHTRPNGTTVGSLVRANNIDYRILGENIACYQFTAKEVVNDWYQSTGHRENMLSDSYSKIGVGIAKTKDGYYYWTQIFTN
ncbi:CAP domain-containing protein [Anaerosacchariphilus polymeriproducens]|uniref:BIG2 domain-containing protein n=1 Tax=Anaerosacchariphilus polymeriproducens TaxID=1812858 RepID=A0A371AZ95_9FIRM|nr:CAP domain-containing protein [Anaerosacchariphilus polymeriproducens]RDU24822.1 hypothetical protein DWV06_02265 [Anaerosacchariphilus polymeriproducens]